MIPFDYGDTAELFVGSKSPSGRYSTGYHKFETAAKALQYAIEELPAAGLLAAVLEVNEERFGHAEIRELYDAGDYPLPRPRQESRAKGGAARRGSRNTPR